MKLAYRSVAENTRPVPRKPRNQQPHEKRQKWMLLSDKLCDKWSHTWRPMILTVNLGIDKSVCVSQNDPRHC